MSAPPLSNTPAVYTYPPNATHPQFGGAYPVHPQLLPDSAAAARSRRATQIAKSSTEWENGKPDASLVSPSVASLAMRRFLAVNIKKEGFLVAEPEAMCRFEQEVAAFVEQIYARAKLLADVAARSGPTAHELLSACEEYDLDIPELIKTARKRSKKRKHVSRAPRLQMPSVPSPSPQLLDSDDENSGTSVAQRLLAAHPHLPHLPPKHTYLRTPAPTTKKTAIPSLEKKLENAGLVQESLKNLLLLTEDGVDKNDGELYGGVVNWESTRQPRKKWKVSS